MFHGIRLKRIILNKEEWVDILYDTYTTCFTDVYLTKAESRHQHPITPSRLSPPIKKAYANVLHVQSE